MACHKDTTISLEDVNTETSEKKQTSRPQSIIKILRESSLLIRRALRPLVCFLRVFGLYFGGYCPYDKGTGIGNLVGPIYSAFGMLLLSFNVVRYIFAFIYNKDFSVYIHLQNFLWMVKCTVQAGYCLLLCRRSARSLSKIQQLISEYDRTINSFSAPDERIRRSFLLRSNIIFGGFLTTVMTNIVCCCFVFFGPYEGINRLSTPLMHPFPVNIATRVMCFIAHTYTAVAWCFPVILYCVLCDSLSLIFSQLFLGIQKMDTKLVVKKHIKEIRRQYVHMSKLCAKTDEMLDFLALCVFFFDLVLSCFNMYQFIYIAKEIPEKILAGFWVFIAIGNLLAISFSASRLADKVRKLRYSLALRLCNILHYFVEFISC